MKQKDKASTATKTSTFPGASILIASRLTGQTGFGWQLGDGQIWHLMGKAICLAFQGRSLSDWAVWNGMICMFCSLTHCMDTAGTAVVHVRHSRTAKLKLLVTKRGLFACRKTNEWRGLVWGFGERESEAMDQHVLCIASWFPGLHKNRPVCLTQVHRLTPGAWVRTSWQTATVAAWSMIQLCCGRTTGRTSDHQTGFGLPKGIGAGSIDF